MRFTHARLGALALNLVLTNGCDSILGIDELAAGETSGASDAGIDAATDGALASDASRGCVSCRVVVEGESAPTELAVLGGRLTWIRSGSAGNVVARSFDGGPIEIGSETPVDGAYDLAIAEGAAHAVGADHEFRRFLDQSSCEDGKGVLHITGFGAELLVLKSGALSRGGCGGRTAILADDLVAVVGDPPHAWYARSNGDVARCDATGGDCAGSAAVLATGQSDVKAMAVGSSRVAWVIPTVGGAEIRSASKASVGASPTPTTIAALDELPKALVADDESVYWTESTSGRVRAAPLAGGETTTIADGLARPWGLLVTSSHVYFSESSAGRIVEVPR